MFPVVWTNQRNFVLKQSNWADSTQELKFYGFLITWVNFLTGLHRSAMCTYHCKPWRDPSIWRELFCHPLIFIRVGADKFLARPGRKQATATKLRIYSIYSPRSSVLFLALWCVFCRTRNITGGKIITFKLGHPVFDGGIQWCMFP